MSENNMFCELQKKIQKLEKEKVEKIVELENTRKKLLGMFITEGIFKHDSEWYDLRNEYNGLHSAVEVAGRKYNTNVMLINMGMTWERLESLLFVEEIDKKRIRDYIALLKADFERVREMFKAEYVKEIVLPSDKPSNREGKHE